MKSVDKKRDKFRGYGIKVLTEGLFLESCNDKETALYTLSVQDRRVNGVFYPSLHKLYVEMEDVAEFNFANTYFESYTHWLKVKSVKMFADNYAAMVSELNAKLRGVAITNMISQVKEGEANQSTLKYLADNDYLPADKKGRPTKAMVDKEVKKQASSKLAIVSDLERIRNS